MTDKQIIIDGIDVSGCGFYDDRYGYCDACKDDIDGYSFTKCSSEDNCYYKQLKRAEAQCEAMFVSHTDLEKKYKAKEQECEELKIYIESNEQQVKEVETLVMDNDRLINELDQLKATLTEIKPILEYYANSTIGEEQEDGTYRIELSYKYGSSNMYGAPCYYKYNPKPARQALQKISEVENETINN